LIRRLLFEGWVWRSVREEPKKIEEGLQGLAAGQERNYVFKAASSTKISSHTPGTTPLQEPLPREMVLFCCGFEHMR